jgi:hypothetical protein
MAASDISRSMSTGLGDFDEGRISGIASVRDLLKFLLD